MRSEMTTPDEFAGFSPIMKDDKGHRWFEILYTGQYPTGNLTRGFPMTPVAVYKEISPGDIILHCSLEIYPDQPISASDFPTVFSQAKAACESLSD